MDYRANKYRLSPFLLILVVPCIFVLLIGCPNPKRFIKFRDETRRVEKLDIIVLGDTLKAKIDAISNFRANFDYYYIHYDINIRCHADCDDLSIMLDSIGVWFGETPMKNACVDSAVSDVKGNENKLTYCFKATCNPYKELVKANENNLLDSALIKIYLGKMLYYKGERLEIDTIYGYEPKADYFLHK